jgi:hypothetical protein
VKLTWFKSKGAHGAGAGNAFASSGGTLARNEGGNFEMLGRPGLILPIALSLSSAIGGIKVPREASCS